MRTTRAASAFALAAAVAACGGRPGQPPARSARVFSEAELDKHGEALDQRIEDALDTLCFVEPTFRHDNGRPLTTPCPRRAAMERRAHDVVEDRFVGGIVDPLAFDARNALATTALAALDRARRSPHHDSRADGTRRDVDAVVIRSHLTAAIAHIAMERDFASSGAQWIRIAAHAFPHATDHQASRVRSKIFAKVAKATPQMTITVARAVDDALDGFEQAGLDLGTDARDVSILRQALDGVTEEHAAPPSSSWKTWLTDTTGESVALERDRRALEHVLEVTRPAAEAALDALEKRSAHDREIAEEQAARIVVGLEPCKSKTTKSKVLALAPPRERHAMCALSHALLDGGEPARAAALVALHDTAVLALRAWHKLSHVKMQREPTALVLVGPTWSARAERLVATEPVRAVGAGFAAEMLLSLGVEGSAEIAQSYDEYGDAPYPIGGPRWVRPPD